MPYDLLTRVSLPLTKVISAINFSYKLKTKYRENEKLIILYKVNSPVCVIISLICATLDFLNLIIILHLQYSPRADPSRNQLLTNMAIGSQIVINYMDLTQIETRENML